MKKAVLFLRIAAVLFVTGGLIWLIQHFSEPGYRGKLLSVWLDEARVNGEQDQYWMDGEPDGDGARAIRAIGTGALPVLLSQLRTRDTPIRKKLRDFAMAYKWIPFDRREPAQLHENALFGFWVLGPTAKSAVPDLVTLLGDDDAQVRAVAAFSLGSLHDASVDAVPALGNYLEKVVHAKPTNGSADPMELYCALHALGDIGPAAHSALPQIKSLATTNGWAEAVMIKISASSLDSVLNALKDPSNFKKWIFGWLVVRELGSNAAPAVPFLIANLQQGDEHVQMDAIEALGKIHLAPQQSVPAIAPFLRSTNVGLRYAALRTLSAFGSSATQWVSASQIVPYLSDSDNSVRRGAINALRRLDPGAALKAGVK